MSCSSTSSYIMGFMTIINQFILLTSSSKVLPSMRKFLTLPMSSQIPASNSLTLRVMQFNVLADGLAALRPDLGRFSRVSKNELEWSNRKVQLLNEITQYDPDIITLQEVDHYHDFFFPQLSQRGYTCYFAPKPTSACLEVGKSGDGCAMFVKRKKLRVISCESKTLALSIAGLKDGELNEDEKNIQLQNQVGVIAVCEIVYNWKNSTAVAPGSFNSPYFSGSSTVQQLGEFDTNNSPPPPIIISTTHLKSSKSGTGERYRQQGVMQILNETEKIYKSMQAAGRTPAVLLQGDFNAVPTHTDYPPLTYKSVKSHPLDLRSVYNDDVALSSVKLSARELYTTWKARRRVVTDKKEVVTKRCIDYIFYGPYKKKNGNGRKPGGGGSRAVGDGRLLNSDVLDSLDAALGRRKAPRADRDGAVVAYTTAQLATSFLLRTAVLVFLAVIPVTSLIDSSLSVTEKIVVLLLSMLGLSIFEFASEGTIFKPAMAAPYSTRKFHQMSETKFAEKKFAATMIKASVGALSEYFTAKQATDGRPGFQAIAALDLYSEGEIGDSLIPSKTYPSDHIAIAADLRLLW